MHTASIGPARRATARRRAAFTTTALAGLIAGAYAQQQPAAPAAAASAAQPATQVINVTGYRGSLAQSAQAKRDAIGLSETVVAEEMGKFPDANIAESLARVPGINIQREVTGEGIQIQIRGLGSSFTRVLLNGAPVASASTGRADGGSANREVDLDFLPTELFTKLTVNKSPTASMLEGGVAGVVDMRSARPFDKSGFRSSFSLQGTLNENAKKWGNRGSALVSNTWGDKFGVLAGVAWAQNKIQVEGYETVGYTNPNLSEAQAGVGVTRNTTGGGNWTIPGTVPANAAAGVPAYAAPLLTPGATIDRALLLALNPGASITQIDNGILPRLGREVYFKGNRDRVNGILALEWRPTDDLDVYVDSVVGKKKNKFDRVDLNWVVRNGAAIPIGMEFDRSDCTNGCVVNKGTFANAQFFLEFRPYEETTNFWGLNPGFEWRLGDKLTVDGQANYTHSDFFRDSPTVLPITQLGAGYTVSYDATVGDVPTIRSNRDLNDPAAYGWFGGSRVNVQQERRKNETKGLRFNLNWGDKDFGIKTGVAYDDVYRHIRSFNNDAAWANVVCGNNLNIYLPLPNTNNPGGCNGASTPGPVAAGTFPGYGTGYTAGQTTPLAYLGSVASNANLRNYLIPQDRGWVTIDWNRFKADTKYDTFAGTGQETTGSTNTGTNPGYIREKVTGLYVESSGRTDFLGNPLRYNGGVRYARTEQIFGTVVQSEDPRNAAQGLQNGGLYPRLFNVETESRTYNNTLPSASVAYNLAPSVISRLSASRSMTRPNPQDLRRTALQFSDPSASAGTLTNASLKPYLSDNVDAGVEWYTGREGYLALSLFKKDIQAFTAAQNTTVTFGSLSSYNVTYQSITQQQREALHLRAGLSIPQGQQTTDPAQLAQINAQTVIITQQVNSDALLKVKGLEATWQQPLGFLPIQGFGFSANYTYIIQRATNNSGFIATGVPEYTSNLTAYYENNGLMFRVSRTFAKGSQGTSSPQNGIPLAQIFGDDYTQVDIAARADLDKLLGWKQKVQLTFDVWNATRSTQRSYFQFANATNSVYKPSTTYVVGVRASF